MIGLDTNVLLRYIAQDDKAQAATATRFIERLNQANPGYLTSVALAELTWVLETAYGASREKIGDIIEGLLTSAEFAVENKAAALRALGRFRAATRAEYADFLIAETCALAGAGEIVTFDKHAARDAGMRLLR